ncbi:MAG: sugar phosphate isomerase/epimerase [Candidatus Bathyarchaeia archaeon]
MKIGLFTVLYNDQPLDQVLDHLSKLGYQAVEIATWKGSTHIDLDAILKGGASAYRRNIEGRGFIISSLSTHLDGQLVLGPLDESTDDWFKGSPDEKVRYGTERVKKAIEAATALEVPVINSFTGCPNWGKWYIFPPANERIWEGYWSLYRERWLPILDYAKDHDIKIAFETHPQEMNYNLETAKRLIEVSENHPSVGFNYDPSHFLWQQMDPTAFIYELGKRIFHMHAKDVECLPYSTSRTGALVTGSWSRGARAVRFRTVGWGQVPWKPVITALLEVGYNYVASVEHEDPTMSRASGVAQAIQFLKPLLQVEPPEVKPWW